MKPPDHSDRAASSDAAAPDASGPAVDAAFAPTVNLRDHHSEAPPYHHIINDEIAIRTEMAFNAAFAGKDHATAAALFEKLPLDRRSFKVRVKHAISRMPNFLGMPLNVSLQVLAGGRAIDPGVR